LLSRYFPFQAYLRCSSSLEKINRRFSNKKKRRKKEEEKKKILSADLKGTREKMTLSKLHF